MYLKNGFFKKHLTPQASAAYMLAACDLNYPHIGATSQNQLLHFLALINHFYGKGNWGAVVQSGYQPYPSVTTFEYKTAASKKCKKDLPNPQPMTNLFLIQKAGLIQNLCS